MIFRKPANDRDLEVLELRMQLDILRGQHSSLQSQYSDVTHRVQIIKHTEQEVLKYLKDIEGILLTFDGDAYVREIDQRTPKDRVIYIVEAINKMKSNYIVIIENLRNQLLNTDSELKKLTFQMEEQSDFVEELKIQIGQKEQEVSHQQALLANSNAKFKEQENRILELNDHLLKWENYSKEQEQYIQSLLALFQQQGGAAGSISTFETEAPSHLQEPLQVLPEPAVILSPTLYERELSKTELEDLKRHAITFLSAGTGGISQRQKDIIFHIGRYGHSERNTLCTGLNVTFQAIREDFISLIQRGVIKTIDILLDGKMVVHHLTDIGVGLYVHFFESEPLVYSEVEGLIRDHDNAQHGYFIRDCKFRLQQQGFQDVVIDRKLNLLDLHNGKQYVPDIIANYEGQLFYIECEHMNQSFKDLTEKLVKATHFTNHIHFIVPSKEELIKAEKFYLEYSILLRCNGRVPLRFSIATRHQFKKGEWSELTLDALSIQYSSEASQFRDKHKSNAPKSLNKDDD